MTARELMDTEWKSGDVLYTIGHKKVKVEHLELNVPFGVFEVRVEEALLKIDDHNKHRIREVYLYIKGRPPISMYRAWRDNKICKNLWHQGEIKDLFSNRKDCLAYLDKEKDKFNKDLSKIIKAEEEKLNKCKEEALLHSSAIFSLREIKRVRVLS